MYFKCLMQTMINKLQKEIKFPLFVIIENSILSKNFQLNIEIFMICEYENISKNI